MKKSLFKVIVFVIFIILLVACFSVFFDEAVLTRKGTYYCGKNKEKLVSLTFDDGPSPIWTPRILKALKDSGIKATFFMLGDHVRKYPDAARQVAMEGHEIENHSYSHHVLLYYKTEELEDEIKEAEKAIKEVTGVTTKYFRPPKAWLTGSEKIKIRDMGYKTVLWSLNSKDWVSFDDKYIIKYLSKNIHPGDIILFHDSGGVFTTEGGNRHETLKTIPRLVDKLRQMGYSFVTINELIEREQQQL